MYFIGYAKSLRNINSIVLLTSQGLWNQEMKSFLRMTWLVRVIDLDRLIMIHNMLIVQMHVEKHNPILLENVDSTRDLLE